MKGLWTCSWWHSRYPVAILAGLLMAAAFPKTGLAGLAWVAPGLMVVAALGKSGGEAFRIGYVAGLTHYLTMLCWLLNIPYRWHGIPIGPAAGWLALSGFLALFPAAWVWLVVGSRGRKAAAGSWRELMAEPGEREGEMGARGAGVLARSWLGRTGWALSGAAAWVAWEMILARIFGGFPWDLLGVSQWQITPLIQMSTVTGVYGVSFLVCWGSLSLISATLTLIRCPTARSVWVRELFLPLLAVAMLFNAGWQAMRSEPAPARFLQLTLVQPSIPQTLIWDSSKDAERFQDLIALTEQALTNRTELLLWPESALPQMLRYDTNVLHTVTNLVRRHRIWMILGSDDVEPHPGGEPGEDDYFNSSFLINPEGELWSRYTKRSLVIFGEYVPFERWLPFLKYLTPVSGGFTPGRHAVPFRLADLGIQTSVLICFEDVFPHLARGDVLPGIDLLVNLTNDGWFGEGAAQWQQAATAAFRAAENRVPLVRCSNTGLTCWVDAYGRMREVFRDGQGSVYGKGFLCLKLPLPDRKLEPTFYSRHGDWFGWACVGLAAAMVTSRKWPRASKTPSPATAMQA